jgi:DNA polymerase
MRLITLDFESFYDSEYTLSKMTTEAYVRDPRFETIMVGLKINDGKRYTAVGENIQAALGDVDIENSAVLCHHAQFDGLILSHHYGLKPKIWFDTLSMGRAELGSVVAKGMSLGSMSEHLGLGQKGHEVVLAKGKRLSDFTSYELSAYREYCQNDVDLTYRIHQKLRPAFSVSELKLIDLTIRLFTEPVLELDTELLAEYKDLVLRHKDYLMLRAGVTREELTSNNRFADVLRRFGVEPELKDSPTAKMPDGTPKRTYAFAKTDDAMKRLVESDDENIQMLAEARLGVKTSIAETRAQRFIDMQKNGPACVYLKYWGAEQTGRHGGGDKCLSGDTEIYVLRSGSVCTILLPELRLDDLVWDGVEFVSHGGLLHQGKKEVITYDKITGTPDHKVFIEGEHAPVALSEAMRRGVAIQVGAVPKEFRSGSRNPYRGCT